jgi:hypothetical protein
VPSSSTTSTTAAVIGPNHDERFSKYSGYRDIGFVITLSDNHDPAIGAVWHFTSRTLMPFSLSLDSDR